MSEQKTKNICPLPWISESYEIGGKSRLCCHQTETKLSQKVAENSSYTSGLKTDLHQMARNNFLNNNFPEECGYCSKQCSETSPINEYRDKFFDVTREIERKNQSSSLATRYLDLTLDDKCNLRCRMCSPEYSSGIAKEWNEMGISFEAPLSDRDGVIDVVSRNLSTIEMITLTGGEPFLSPSFKKIIDLLVESKRSTEVVLRIYTNASIYSDTIVEKFKSFKKIELFFSIDGVGKTQEYIRHPVSWDEQEKIIKKWLSLKLKNLKISNHLVFQALNATKIVEYLSFFAQYGDKVAVIPSATELTHPTHLQASVLPKDLLKRQLNELENWVYNNQNFFSGNHGKANLLGLQNLRHLFNSALKQNSFEKSFFNFVLLSKKLDLIKGQTLTLTYPEFQNYS